MKWQPALNTDLCPLSLSLDTQEVPGTESAHALVLHQNQTRTTFPGLPSAGDTVNSGVFSSLEMLPLAFNLCFPSPPILTQSCHRTRSPYTTQLNHTEARVSKAVCIPISISHFENTLHGELWLTLKECISNNGSFIVIITPVWESSLLRRFLRSVMSLVTYSSSAGRQFANCLKFLQAIDEKILGPYLGRTTSKATVKNSVPLFFREHSFSLKRRRKSGLFQCLWCQNPSQITWAIPRTSMSISPEGPGRPLATVSSWYTFWGGIGDRQRITLGWKTLLLLHLLPEKHLKTPSQKPDLAALIWPIPIHHTHTPPTTTKTHARSKSRAQIPLLQFLPFPIILSYFRPTAWPWLFLLP